MLKFIFKIIASILLLAIAITSLIQGFSPIYNFAVQAKFAGNSIYNPYAGIDSAQWLKSNFHAHTQGDTDDYTTEAFIEGYKRQGYDIIGTADHQYINTQFNERPGYIAAYEHGIGLNNFHLLMLGADHVSWFDYPIMAIPKHQMQHSFNKFKPQVKVLGVNHTERLRLVPLSVFESLTGYDLMEMNPDHDPTAWDIALSSGIHSHLVANDDAHSIERRGSWMQRCFTMVNSPSTNADSILSNLTKGAAYGIAVPVEVNTLPNPHANLPLVTSIGLKIDTIYVSFDRPAESILFRGDRGKTLHNVDLDSIAQMVIPASASYVRIEAYFPDGEVIWSNPFVRTIDGKLPVAKEHTIDLWMTIVNCSCWSIVFLLIITAIYTIWSKKKVDRYRNLRSF